MRRSHAVLGVIAAGILALGGGAYAVADPSPSGSTVPQPNAAARSLPASGAGQVLSTTKRGTCVKNGTGEYRDLWLVEATGKCPSGFWGPKVFGGGAPGPQGPKGDKGDPGDSRIVIASGSVKVTANGVYDVVVKGLPKLTPTQAKRFLADVDAEVFGSDVTVTLAAPTADTAGTTWTFKATVGGYTATTPDKVLKVDVLAIPPVPAATS